jgi:chorismate mutase/prephenate dehydratase
MPQDKSAPLPQADTAPQDALAALRREIDGLDAAMLALIDRRVAAVTGIAELKASDGDRLRLRPGREAAVIERLVASARVAPEGVVRHIWREIMAACLELQIAGELILHAASEPALLTDAMRQRFGSSAAMTIASSASDALAAARTREAVAVIELTPNSEWWSTLLGDPTLAMFECLRDPSGRAIGIAVGRIAAEDLHACPEIAIVDDARVADRRAKGAELLASNGGLHLCVSAAPAREGGR